MDYNNLASVEVIEKTINSLKERGFLPEVIETREAALMRIKELIPGGATVMNGSSRTLEEIGFIEHLKTNNHGWKNLHADILALSDTTEQQKMREQAFFSEFYLGSVHALTESGELLIASNSGSQLPHLVSTSANLILVVGAQKIVPTVDEAFKRLDEQVIPLEEKRMRAAQGVGTYPSKVLLLNREPDFMGRKVRLLIVNEILGY
ncbi:MAG: lactate utilization protein [Patescibacteria group bacterium]|jgi:L-lactate utilization protein LutC|nr:lactate utilization protein [Patescibacteria group bacterium]MDD3435285.1 lactate utilization protein [Patescibacteria group bacterium]